MSPPSDTVCPECHALHGMRRLEGVLDDFMADGGRVREFLDTHKTEIVDAFVRGATHIYGGEGVRWCRQHTDATRR